MSDFGSKQLKEIIDEVRRVCFSTRRRIECRFEFYTQCDEIKLGSSDVNRNVERVHMLLEELKKDYGLAYEVKDTQKMSSKQVKQAYDSSAHWASNPNRPYGISRMIYDIFVGGEAGDRFGKEIPAMIVYDFTGDILFVLPHIVKRKCFSLVRGPSTEGATITIYDFLTFLKDDLKKKS